MFALNNVRDFQIASYWWYIYTEQLCDYRCEKDLLTAACKWSRSSPVCIARICKLIAPRSISQSINQSINQSIIHSFIHSFIQSVSQSVSRSVTKKSQLHVVYQFSLRPLRLIGFFGLFAYIDEDGGDHFHVFASADWNRCWCIQYISDNMRYTV